jgi:hypothetical protein
MMHTHYVPALALRHVCRQIARYHHRNHIPVVVSRPVPADHGTVILLPRENP